MQNIKNSLFVIIENFDYIAILLLLFVAVGSLVFAFFFLITQGGDKTRLRLARMIGMREDADESNKPRLLSRESGGLAAKISRPMHGQAAVADRSMQNQLRLSLIQAGFRSDKALYNYLAAKVLLPLVLVGIYLATNFLYRLTSDVLIYVIFLAALGFLLPNFWLTLTTRARQKRIFKGLPDALDLMVVCVEAGLGLDMTFKRVGEEIRMICPDLSEEFSLTNLEVRAGKARDEAFRNMALRANTPEVHNLITVLTQTSRFGTSLATALRVHADAMRIKRRQIAEETAAKSTVKMVFPLVLFIFPAIFVVLIGPGAIRIIKTLFPALGG